MPPHKPKLVFTAPKITQGFMADDMTLLRPYVDIIPLDLAECTGPLRYTYFTRLLHALIRERAEVLFAYFVVPKYTPLAALLAKALGCKVIIIAGGIDATYVPDIRWGDMGDPLRRRLFALTMRLSDSVLPASNSSRNEVLVYGKPRRIRTAYHMIDADMFRPGPLPRERRAVTAAYVITEGALLQKGIGPFVGAAAFAPDVEFVVIGDIDDTLRLRLQAQATPNVRFTGHRLDKCEYAALLGRSAVYVQASAHEGFGVSLAEGMAAGCVPVVADRYAMPEVVGGTGYVVPFNDARALAQAVQEAVAHPEKGLAAHRRVVENFTAQRRQALLHEELEAVLGRQLALEVETQDFASLPGGS